MMFFPIQFCLYIKKMSILPWTLVEQNLFVICEKIAESGNHFWPWSNKQLAPGPNCMVLCTAEMCAYFRVISLCLFSRKGTECLGLCHISGLVVCICEKKALYGPLALAVIIDETCARGIGYHWLRVMRSTYTRTLFHC